MGKKSDLSPECQKFVKKLFAFYSKEKATKKPIVTFDRVSGADPGFQVRGRGGAYLKKLRRAEGGAKIFGVFRVKIRDFTPKKQITESPSYP